MDEDVYFRFRFLVALEAEMERIFKFETVYNSDNSRGVFSLRRTCTSASV